MRLPWDSPTFLPFLSSNNNTNAAITTSSCIVIVAPRHIGAELALSVVTLWGRDHDGQWRMH